MKTRIMKAKSRPRTKAITPEIPEFEDVRVIERPDGYYWQAIEGKQERGPYPTRLEAEQALAIVDEETLEVGETLAEAEAEIGIADWIDPETGELAEEEVSRIEEH